VARDERRDCEPERQQHRRGEQRQRPPHCAGAPGGASRMSRRSPKK
jgi:hypothetical protein